MSIRELLMGGVKSLVIVAAYVVTEDTARIVMLCLGAGTAVFTMADKGHQIYCRQRDKKTRKRNG